MKAKKFKEWILESRQPKVAWDGAKIWFDKETNFTELLGQDIWQIRTHEIDEAQLVNLIKQLERDLEVVVQPIILTSSPNTFAHWFSTDKRVLPEDMEDWSDQLTGDLKKYIDIFRSNATGIDRILDRGGNELTEEQLVQLMDWVGDRGLNPDFLESITRQIKAHPNWPEDMTDWALGDW